MLAIAYRRSALYDAGERMIREPIDVAEQRHRPGALAVALDTYSQILIGMRRYPEASVVALRAREAYRKFADPFGDALTELTLCQIEIERDHFGEAAQYCHDHDATFAAAHREDLIYMGLAYQSRLAVVHGDIARADRLIEKAFSLPSGFRSPAEDIELLENRAKVGQAEGNDSRSRFTSRDYHNWREFRRRACPCNHAAVGVGGGGPIVGCQQIAGGADRAATGRYERAQAAEARIADVIRTRGIRRGRLREPRRVTPSRARCIIS